MDKKQIKIKTVNLWPDWSVADFKYRLVPYLLDEYDFVESDEPDFVIFSNQWPHPMPRLRSDKFVSIFMEGEYCKIDMSNCDYAFTHHYIDDSNHFRLPVYSVKTFMTGMNPNDLIKKDIDIIQIKQEKDRFCNYLSSNCTPRRDNFFKLLCLLYKRVDAAGKCCNNMHERLTNWSGKEHGAQEGEAQYWNFKEKYEFQRRYKFTMAFQNDRADWNDCLGYTTDILTDPMLVNSIPLYWGDPRVGEEFNTKSFLNYGDYQDEISFIGAIKDVDQDDKLWKDMLMEPWFIDNKLPPCLDVDILKEFWKGIFK